MHLPSEEVEINITAFLSKTSNDAFVGYYEAGVKGDTFNGRFFIKFRDGR